MIIKVQVHNINELNNLDREHLKEVTSHLQAIAAMQVGHCQIFPFFSRKAKNKDFHVKSVNFKCWLKIFLNGADK